MQIQWFPGHMAKARREVEEKLKLVDFVIELVDARAPNASMNPMLQTILHNKPRLVVLMKKDLANDVATNHWIDYINQKDHAIAVNVHNKTDMKQLMKKAKELGQIKIDQLKAKGILPRPARAMIVGIPNVGKSTLINQLVRKKATKTGNTPGITKQQLWVKVGSDFELLDTPGILWPKFETEEIAYHLAAIGSIKDTILPLQDVAAYVLKFLFKYHPDIVTSRYGIDVTEDDMYEIFIEIGKRVGALESGGMVNFEKVSHVVLNDFREGRLGKITLDQKPLDFSE